MTSLIRRPLIGPIYSGEPVARDRAPSTSVVFIAARPAEPDEPAETAEVPATEAAPASTCSACETFGEALARIEKLLNSLLVDVENLRVRLDTALGNDGD